MNREGHNNAKFFIGAEVEQTPAVSKKTLFVVGKQDLATIEKIARANKVPHIFMGANHSFSADVSETYWATTITALLDKGYWVTLDYQAHEHEIVLKMLSKGVWQCRNFVPLLGVRIPHIETSSLNLTIKIDDSDFKATNPGVWCLSYREVTDSNRFTSWEEYGTDELVEDVSEPVAAPKTTPAPTTTAAPVVKETVVDVVDKAIVETLNNQEVGLDTTATSALKDDPEETQTPVVTEVANVEAAYAEGAKEDPIAVEAAVKKTTKGKKE